MSDRNYWCYRIDTSQIPFFKKELDLGRLRQGWGGLPGQDLRILEEDYGAKRNKPMLKVKKGDVLLVPRLPSWDYVAIVIATEDWEAGYKYQIDENLNDYGHIFPAKLEKQFLRHSGQVSGNIRATLKNPSRFWNINHYKEDVEKLLNAAETELEKSESYESRMEIAINEVFNANEFSNKLYKEMNWHFSNEEWEYALVHGLRRLFPEYVIDRRGGIKEAEHGTDILIRIPGIFSDIQYGIAVQVKDYKGFVESGVINQINKAEYWNNYDDIKLIDKIIIITKASEDVNPTLKNIDPDVQIVFAKELKELLLNMGKTFIGVK